MSETIHEKLAEIQSALRVPKGQWNDFSKFHYRSCEDILHAAKPHVLGRGLVLTLNDEIVPVLDRVYVKATVKLTDGKSEIVSTAFAREELTKKGMDGSQITGTASSYARKYALNGLFCIDDTKDADTLDNREQAAPPPKPITDKQVATLDAMIDEVGAEPIKFMRWLKVNDLAELTADRYDYAVAALEKKRAAA